MSSDSVCSLCARKTQAAAKDPFATNDPGYINNVETMDDSLSNRARPELAGKILVLNNIV